MAKKGKNKMTAYEHYVQYYETDQMGIVHHSNYIRWMEEARTYLMAQIGFPYKEMEETGIIVPVLYVRCDYKSMVHFEDTVVIYPRITKFKGTRLEFSYEMRDKQTGELKTLGESGHCFMDTEGSLISLKKSYPDIFRLFKEYETESQEQ